MISILLDLIEEECDQILFAKIYKDYQKQMWHIAVKYLKNNELAEDTMQNVFLRIARNIKTLRDLKPEQVRCYVFVATRHGALDTLKIEKRHQFCDIDSLYDVSDKLSEDNIENKISQSYIVDIIERIPTKYKEVMYMRFLLGVSYKDMAKILGITANNARQRVLRGREKFIEIYNLEMDTYGNDK